MLFLYYCTSALNLSQGETDSVDIGRESDMEVSCHPYYLTCMENIYEESII
jgi:hypothetical protein